MRQTIKNNKFVELNYQVINQKNGDIISQVDTPLGYVHGNYTLLFKPVQLELGGKCVGDKIEVPINCDTIFGKHDKNLVFTDDITNVPKQYHSIGTKIVMSNKKGQHRDFFVTNIKNGKLTIDGNNPLCGKKITFRLKVLSIRNATKEEIKRGGAIDQPPTIL